MPTKSVSALALMAIKSEIGRGYENTCLALSKLLATPDVDRTTAEFAALSELHSYLSANHPSASVETTLLDWSNVAPRFRARLPKSLLGAVLRARLGDIPPKHTIENWLLGQPARADLEEALESRLLTPPALVAFAKRHPDVALSSDVLDVLISLRKTVPPEVRRRALELGQRPDGRVSLPVVLARWLAYEPDRTAADWITDAADANPVLTEQVILSLFRQPLRLFMLGRAIATSALSPTGSANKRRLETLSAAIPVLLSAIDAAIEEGHDRVEPALALLGTLVLTAGLFPQGFSTGTHRLLRSRSLHHTVGRFARALHRLEESRAATAPECAFVMTPSDGHAAVTEFLKGLGVGQERGSGDRGSEAARMRGKRDIIEMLVQVADLPEDSSAAREMVQDILFNVGARHHGTPGERVAFDVHLHELEAGAALAGDRVTVSRAGWYLGSVESPLIIRKATVVADSQSAGVA